MSNYNPERSGDVPIPQDSYRSNGASPREHSSERQRLERLSQEVQALKQAAESDAQNHRREVSSLRGQLGLLTGVSLAAIALLAATAGWLGFSLKTEQARLAEQVESAKDKSAGTQQIEGLEDQISTFQRQVRSLGQQAPEAIASEIRGVQDRLRELETQVKEIATDVKVREQVIDTLERALQTLNKEEPSTPSTPAPAADSSDPPNSN